MNNNTLFLLNDAVRPWIGAADDDEITVEYAKLNTNAQTEILKAVRRDIIPHLSAMNSKKRGAIVDALKEVQSMPPEQLERLWESILPPFSLPDTPGLLFKWMAEEIALSLPSEQEYLHEPSGGADRLSPQSECLK